MQAVTLRFDKALLETWCFKTDPEAISKLPGAPEFGSVEVTFTLQASGWRSAEGCEEDLNEWGSSLAKRILCALWLSWQA